MVDFTVLGFSPERLGLFRRATALMTRLTVPDTKITLIKKFKIIKIKKLKIYKKLKLWLVPRVDLLPLVLMIPNLGILGLVLLEIFEFEVLLLNTKWRPM